MPSINTTFLLIAFAAVFIGISLTAMTGIYKKWYWKSPRRAYPYLPLGLLFLLAMFDDELKGFFPGNEWIVTAIYAVFMAVVIWFAVAPPRVLKPKWIRIIEEQPPNVYQELARQAEAGEAWMQHVRDEQSLRLWVEQARRKAPKKKDK